MKIRLLILGLCMALVVPAFAQQTEVDVTKLLADTKTFIFSNNKNTVKTYIYEEMEGKTTCCGNDRIYLEIKIDPSGYVLQAKTLTGKNDCYKKSAIDIVKNIKWDAKGFKGPKSVYFEIKPEVECEEARTNTYAALPLFNNEVLDENGVPLSYASSTGVSASQKSGVSTTPTGVPATPVNPKPSTAGAGEPAVASNAGTTQPPATKPAVDAGAGAAGGAGSDVSEPMASNTKPGTGVPNTATNTSDNELEKAKTMAKMEKVQQDDEIEKLKKELEQMKELEKQRAEKESEKARREEAAKERERILNLQKEKDARAKREREAARARETERPVASNNSGSQGGFRDVDYSDDGGNNSSRGGGYDYSDDRGGKAETDPPPRAKTAAERAREEKARLDRELEDLKRKQQDFDRDERARLADKERTAKDIARLQEQILRKAEEERKASEKEALDQLEVQRREADQRKRDMEQAVQRKMDELKRMQMDMDRQLADLKRLEEEAKRKEEEKMQREQEITAEQQIRQQQMEAEIERQKLMAGGGGVSTRAIGGTMQMPTFNPQDSLSGSSVAFLAAQIEQLRRDILGLQNALGGGTTSPVLRSSPSSPRNRTAGAPATASGEKSAVLDRSWKGTDYSKDGVYYPTTASAAPGGDLRPDPSHAGTHENVTIPRAGAPTYAGGVKAMNSLIADKLLAAGICGMAEATFELEVNGQGNVVQHRVLSVGTPEMQFQLPAILQSLKFEPSNSRFNQSLFSIFKTEIACKTPETSANEMPESTDQ